jgi:hypothetical protein
MARQRICPVYPPRVVLGDERAWVETGSADQTGGSEEIPLVNSERPIDRPVEVSGDKPYLGRELADV